MNRIALLLGCCLMASAVLAQQETVRAKSIFWEITGPNLQNPSYLYGTMHVSSKIAFKVPQLFFTSLEKVDVVALESDPAQWQSGLAQDSTMNYISQIYKRQENSLINGSFDFYTRLIDIFDLSRGHLKWLMSRKSTLANQLLFRTNPFSAGLSEETYLDMYIYQVGQKLGKPVLGLEQISTSTLKAYKAALIEEAKPRQGNESIGNIGREIEDSYKDKNIEKLDSLYTKAFSQGYLENLLYSRNRDMMVSMDSLFDRGLSAFIAVGAAHLAGDQGLLSMLESEGFTVRPILDTTYYDPSAALLKYDTVFVPSTSAPHWSIDSSLSFSAPGYAARQVEPGLVEYLCTDLTNGVYYKINRVPIFNGFIDNGNLLSRIDSLLYESTEGKILSKKNTTVSGHPAIRVNSKTQQGRNVWSVYILSPYELIIAELQGPEKWQGADKAESFIQSIKTHYNLKKSTLQNGALKTQGYVTISDFPFATYDVNRPNYMHYGNDGKHDYLLLHTKRHGQRGIEEDVYETQSLVRAFADRIGATITHTQDLTRDRRTITRATLKSKKGNIQVETRVRAENYYLLATTASKKSLANWSQSTKTDELPSVAATPYTDDSMGYTLQTFVGPYGAVLNPYLFLAQIQNSTFATDSKKKLNINYFQNADLGYEIELSVKQVNPYRHFDTEDSLWSYYYNDLRIKHAISKNHDTLQVIDSSRNEQLQSALYKVIDPKSSTYLLIRVLLTGDREYMVSTVLDTSSALSAQIYDHIASMQVRPLGPIYSLQSTFDRYRTDLFSTDSLTKKIFATNNTYFTPDSCDISDLRVLLDTSETLQSKPEQYFELISYLSQSSDTANQNYLKKLYLRNERNFDKQFAILEALALMRDSSATLLLKDLLLENPPLESGSYNEYAPGVSAVLDPYRRDSTLTPLLYPEIMELMDYDEYSGPISTLTALQSRFCDLDSSLYASKVPYFYKKLRAEFRRQTTQPTLLEKLQMPKEEQSDQAGDAFYGQDRYYISEEGYTDDYIESDINLYSYYSLFLYYEILRKFRHEQQVEALLSEIDQSTNTDLHLYNALDHMEDHLDYELEPIKTHINKKPYWRELTKTLLQYDQVEQLQEISPPQDTFANWLTSSKLKIDPKEESLSLIDKHTLKQNDSTKKIYVYTYQKSGEDSPLYAFLGLFIPDQKFLKDYIWLQGLKLEDTHLTIEEILTKLSTQIDALKREYVDPSSFSIYLHPERRDPFWFLQ